LNTIKIILLAVSMAVAAEPVVQDSVVLLPPGAFAPSFSLQSPGGERHSLSMWCGKQLSKPHVNKVQHTIIVSFWATYCLPCQKEIPELMKFAEKHAKDPIKIFCISLDKEGEQIVSPFVKQKGYTIPVLLDPYKRIAANFGVKSLPALFVIGPDGIIRYSSVGYNEDVKLDELLEKAVQSAVQFKNFGPAPESGKIESVDVKPDIAVSLSQNIAPRDKWHSVARVECGEDLKIVAAESGVPADTLKLWCSQLKEAALEKWNSKK
jgi:thiol-disulfide isomerase/thioredoxin